MDVGVSDYKKLLEQMSNCVVNL